jgi:hypothetical protein
LTIHVKDHVGGDVQSVRIRIDPGSMATGVAIITDAHVNKPRISRLAGELANASAAGDFSLKGLCAFQSALLSW